MLNEKLTQLQTAFNTLKEKILTKLTTQQELITETSDKLVASNHQLEIKAKEASDNEILLDKLLSDFQELQTALE